MTDSVLLAAQAAREDLLLSEEIDRRLDLLLADVSNADTVGPDARNKLKGILQHYAKDPHPFRACVKDNMKRFGPGRTEAVCATLKDIIRGTTKWRGHPELDHGSAGLAASDLWDEDVETLLMAIDGDKLERLLLEVAR